MTFPFEYDHGAPLVFGGALPRPASFEAARVQDALSQLPQVQREALELAYFGGCTYADVAARLGVPLGTAKTRIRDGLLRLRDLLGDP